MNDFAWFMFGALYAAVFVIAICVPIIEFYKGRYEAALDFIMRRKITSDDNEKENEKCIY